MEEEIIYKNGDEELKYDNENKWVTEEISRIFAERYPHFEDAQWIGFTSQDEPNQVSYMVNAKGGFLMLEMFYEVIGEKKLIIKKFKLDSSGEEIEW